MSTTEKTRLPAIVIDEATLVEAQGFIAGCEWCAWTSGLTFDHVLDALTGSDAAATEYVLCRAATCPRCNQELTGKTLVLAV